MVTSSRTEDAEAAAVPRSAAAEYQGILSFFETSPGQREPRDQPPVACGVIGKAAQIKRQGN